MFSTHNKEVELDLFASTTSIIVNNETLNKIICLHFMMYINKNMLIELCASDYATFNGRVKEIDKIFQTLMPYNDKI